MSRPFKKKSLRDKLEAQLSDLAEQTDELRKQVVERAPGVRDQLITALPDKDQLLDLRDDLFERLPENVQERLPDKVKPRHKRLRKVAAVGVLAGASAAAFAMLRRKGAAHEAYTPPTAPSPAPTPSPTPAEAAPTAADLAEDPVPPVSASRSSETTG